MTIICYPSKNYVDAGLEWGSAFYLTLSSPEMQYEHFHMAAKVERVLVARRKRGGNRTEGYYYRYFVRLPDGDYDPYSYYHVLEMGGPTGPYGRQLFLSETDAWEHYAAWLQDHVTRYAEYLRVAEQMRTEALAMARLKAH